MAKLNFTPGQERIIKTLDKPLFVAAGAGSGKTFTLTQRVIWALSEGSGENGKPYLDSIDQMLVITFTDAAAQEIKERVRAGLRQAGLEKQALAVDNAWISTIHGMCSRMLKRYAHEFGLDPEFSVINDVVANEMLAEAENEVLGQIKDDPQYKLLFDTFKPQASGFMGASSSVMGMVSSIATAAVSAPGGFDDIRFVGEPQSPYEICQNFIQASQEVVSADQNNSAAAKLAQANLALIEPGFDKVRPATFTIDEALELLGKATKPTMRCGKDIKPYVAASKLAYEAGLAELQMSNLVPLRQQILDLAKRVVEVYDAKKKARSVLDNDDLLRMAQHMLLCTHTGDKYCEQFKMVMIDEFQDTNQQQVDMISELSGENCEHLCTVGDAQQSIYRFRGADVEVFNQRKVEVGEASTVFLDQNFRSHDDVLRFVRFICDRPEMIDGFMDLEAGRKEQPKAFRASNMPRVDIELTVAKKLGRSGPSAELRAYAQATQIAHRLAEYAKNHVNPGDMALLLGRMKYADIYAQALRSQGLDSVISGGSTFTQAEEVHIVQALLYALSNPSDTKRGLFPVLTSEMFHLDANDLAMLATRKQTSYEAPCKRPCDIGFRDMEFYGDRTPSVRLVHAKQVMEKAWELMKTKDMADVVMEVVRESGWLWRLDEQGVEGQAKVANILRAIQHIRNLGKDLQSGPATIADKFAVWLQVAKEHPATLVGERLDAVQIMTVHASKGLEFPVVAVAECLSDPASVSKNPLLLVQDDGEVMASLKPSGLTCLEDDGYGFSPAGSLCASRLEIEEIENTAALAEKARLLYVALTRAREAIILGGIAQPSSKGISPYMLQVILNQGLNLHDIEPGVFSFEYGGSCKGVLNVVCLQKTKEPQCEITGEDELCSLIDAWQKENLHPAFEQEEICDTKQEFTIYDKASQELSSIDFWQPRSNVFSYSSMHKDAHTASSFADEQLVLDDVHIDAPLAEIMDEDKEDSLATNLGTAFHELCEYIVQTNAYPDGDRILTTAKLNGCTRAQGQRLEAALLRWYESELRKQALEYRVRIAEAPFFASVESEHGDYIEGAIDLLCYNDRSGKAFVVDYKTGDGHMSFDEIYKSHLMQARFYARTLFLQGFTLVECAFVCVELEDENGQPVVARYHFDSIEQTD